VTLQDRLRSPLARDGAVAFAGAFVATAVLAWHHHAQPHAIGAGTVVSTAGAILALAFRRRWPLGVLCAIAALALLGTDMAPITLPLMFALYTVARSCEIDQIAFACAVAMAGWVGGAAIHHEQVWTFPQLLSRVVAIGLAVAAGLWRVARSEQVEGLRDQARQLERERMLLAEHAVAAERVRIARELHDAVAHSVSLMVVQAQALAALADTERDAAGDRIAAIGREALTEMHHMLDVLRPGDEAPELAPAPGVRDVPGLVARARGAGINVALAVEGRPRALPAGLDLSAYRIVQEALTNVIKHARALRTEVRVRYRSDALELSVIDDGTGAAGGGVPGHGLVGMRERVALFGGTLEAGARSDAPGYAVRAVLPL
jgi:signal transduction histidine kinase